MEKLAIVIGNLPTIEEIDQFRAISEHYEVTVLTSESIALFLQENSFFRQLLIMPLPDYDDSTTYLPGLEKALNGFGVVIVLDRVGLCAYQTIKAKRKFHFHLLVLVNNGSPFIGQDIPQLRSIRTELDSVADGFLVQTQTARMALLLEGITSDRIYFLTPWVGEKAPRGDSERRQARLDLGANERDLVIGYLGEVEWEEGLLDLLHGLRHFMNEAPSYSGRLKVIIYGIGSFALQVRQRTIELDIDRQVIYPIPCRQAYISLLSAMDMLFLNPHQTNDRLDGSPFRQLVAMRNRIPIVTCRSSVVEDIVEKHRIDFCPGSIASIAAAFGKAFSNKSLVHNLADKNQKKIDTRFNQEHFKRDFFKCIAQLTQHDDLPEDEDIDRIISDIEKKVRSKQYLVAVDQIEKVLSRTDLSSHHRSDLLRLIGDSFTKLGDIETGRVSYTQAIEIDMYNWKSHIGLGTISLIKQTFEIGVIHFQKAIALAPDDEMASLGLGLSFQGLDELRESEKWISKALVQNPENTAAIYSLMRVSTELGNFNEIERALTNYLSIHPNDLDMQYSLAGILYEDERYEASMEIIQEMIRLDPLNSRAQSLMRKLKRSQEKSRMQSVNM